MRKNLLLLLGVFVFLSCKKSNSNDSGYTCPLNSATIGGLYKLTKVTKITIASGNVTEIDATTDINACELDDTYEFNSGSFLWTDAGTTCPGTVFSGTILWTLSGNNLTKDIQGYLPNPWNYIIMDDFIVQQFDCASIVLQKKVPQTATSESGVRYYLKRP